MKTKIIALVNNYEVKRKEIMDKRVGNLKIYYKKLK